MRKPFHLLLVALTALSCKGAPEAAVEDTVPITPAWALGHIVWEDEFNTADAVRRLVDGYLERGIPVNGVIIDSPWSTAYNNFKWDLDRYPDPAGLTADLKAKGVHSLLWLTGCINTVSGDVPINKSENFDEAVASGFAVNDGKTGKWWKGEGIHIDFTNREAVDWWYRQLDGVMAEGVDGFKVDGGETAFGDSVKTSIGVLTNKEFRPYCYDAMYDFVTSRRPEMGVILARPFSTRSGGEFSSQEKMSLGWCGDFTGEWSGLKLQISDIYKSAEVGYGAVGTEIGGFYGTPSDKGQLIRYAQFASMTASMINGGSRGPFSNHLAWWHGPDAEAIYREVTLLHCQLVPYIFSTLVEAHINGGTLIRDADIESETHRFGPDFFTKAITSDDAHVTFALPPEGEWADWKTGERFPGGSIIERDYGLDEFPLFIRVGAIVPMRTDEGLTLLVCPGAEKASVTVHWPEGDGIAFRDFTASFDPATGEATVSDGTPFKLALR